MARSIHDVAVILAARTGGEVYELRGWLIEHARTSGLVPLASEVTVVDDDQTRALLRAGTTAAAPATATATATATEAITRAAGPHHAAGVAGVAAPSGPGGRS